MTRKALVALLVLLVFLSVSAVPAKAETLENGGIIMQAFYWDVPGGQGHKRRLFDGIRPLRLL